MSTTSETTRKPRSEPRKFLHFKRSSQQLNRATDQVAVDEETRDASTVGSTAARHPAGHDAGHLVAARHLGVLPETVEDHLGVVSVQLARSMNLAPTRVLPKDFMPNALVSFAGPIAERAAVRGYHVMCPYWFDLSRHWGDEDDIVEPGRWADHLGVTRWRTLAARNSAKLVHDHWAEILDLTHRIDRAAGSSFGRQALRPK